MRVIVHALHWNVPPKLADHWEDHLKDGKTAGSAYHQDSNKGNRLLAGEYYKKKKKEILNFRLASILSIKLYYPTT